jgi:hypothetical protein
MPNASADRLAALVDDVQAPIMSGFHTAGLT